MEDEGTRSVENEGWREGERKEGRVERIKRAIVIYAISIPPFFLTL